MERGEELEVFAQPDPLDPGQLALPAGKDGQRRDVGEALEGRGYAQTAHRLRPRGPAEQECAPLGVG